MSDDERNPAHETMEVVVSTRVYRRTRDALDRMAQQQRRKVADLLRIIIEDAVDHEERQPRARREEEAHDGR